MLYDNPAAALHSILERGASIKHEESCHVVWSRLLEITPDDQDGLIQKLSAVMNLPSRSLILVKTSFPNQFKSTKSWVNIIEVAFMQQQLNGHWGSFIAHIPSHCLAHLSITAELIQTRLETKLIPEEDLNRVMQGIHSLVSEIDSSPLDNSLKAYLGRELGELQRSIRNYKISGAIPILQQTEAMLGHSLLDPSYSSFLTNHALGAKLLENLSAMANVLTVAVSLPQLTQGLGSLLIK